jgi:predicted membrane-bound spermidine synthase
MWVGTDRVALLALAAFTGAATMACELALVRMLSPALGTSLPVWGVVISLVLMSLASGAALGARWSRSGCAQTRAGLASVAAGALVTLMPHLGPEVVETLGSPMAAGADRLLAALALGGAAGVPLVLVGAVTPLLVCAGAPRFGGAGAAAGRLGASATLGSLVGTLGAAFWTVPVWGTRATLATAGVLLVFGAIPCTTLAAHGRRRIPYASATAALALVAAGLALGAARLPPEVICQVESPYDTVRVDVDRHGVHRLRTGADWTEQAVWDPRGPARYGSWPLMASAPALAGARAGDAPDVAVLGFGGGTIARDIRARHPCARIDGVELDPVVLDVGRAHLRADDADAEVSVGDARRWLARAPRRYDTIIVDAFHGPYVPFHLVTRESFALARRSLRAGGVLAINAVALPRERALADAIACTLADVFRHVSEVHAPNGLNVVLYASDRPLARVPGIITREVDARGGAVLTDDRAPVEHLVHRMAWSWLTSGGAGVGE